MLFVIQKKGDGFHPHQSCSAWTENPYPETHAIVPPELVADVLATGDWCDLELSADGSMVVGVTPRERDDDVLDEDVERELLEILNDEVETKQAIAELMEVLK